VINAEIFLRFLLLLVILACYPGLSQLQARRAGATDTLLLAFCAWGVGVLSDLKADSPAAAAAAASLVLVAAAIVAAVPFLRHKAREEPPAAMFVPLLGACAGFSAGAGLVLAACSVALGGLLLEVLAGPKPDAPLKSTTGNLRAVTVRAQSLRGLVGRIEAALERCGLQARSLTLESHPGEKELIVTFEVAVPHKEALRELLDRLNEVEGVLEVSLG